MLAAWAIPVAFHAGFDLPILALHEQLGGMPAMAAMAAIGLLVWSAALGLAIATQRRLAAPQQNALSAEVLAQCPWRDHWRQLVVGALSAFTGAVLAGAAIHRSWLGGDKPDIAATAGGVLLIAVGAALFAASRQRLVRENSAGPA